mmetsp:Transcript_4531/g.10045  ORF Transcript_4531/g.10045 Transcript_4531/m.10045 type:complete len:423 (+) Transcript_4531:274-1542(+)
MMPYNYIKLLTLDKQNSAGLPGSHPHKMPHQEGRGAPRQVQQPCQIEINSTIDADIVLRRIIEDRAAIIALKSRAATNEAELMKVKTRQLNITKFLECQDQEIGKLSTKATHELDQYNENCKDYIRSFMLAFERGDMDKLPQHPFQPSLEALDEAINRRKATLIEKVQVDDRVKKLEFINSQERVTMEVMKKNEEAFLRAIAISKQKFSDCCVSWRNRVGKLLYDMPHHAKEFNKYTLKGQRPKIQAQEKTSRYPPTKTPHVTPPQPKRRIFVQDPKQPFEKYHMSPEMSLKVPIVHVSPLRYAKSPIESIEPWRGESSRKTERAPPLGLAQEESQENKRQKVERQLANPASPVAPQDEKKIIDLSDGNEGNPDQQSDVDVRDDGKKSTSHGSTDTEDTNDEFSMAHILTRLQGDEFAVPNI